MAELNVETVAVLRETIHEDHDISLTSLQEEYADAQLETSLIPSNPSCPTVSDVTATLQGIAEHIHAEGLQHGEECFSKKNFDGDNEEIQTLSNSVDAVRDVIDTNTTMNKGKRN